MEHIRWLAEPTLAQPGGRVRLHRLERRRRRRIDGVAHPRRAMGGDRPRRDRSRSVHRLRHRPPARATDDGRREIVWPTVGVWSASLPGSDVILVLGPEPALRWRSFCEQIIGVAEHVRRTDDDHARRAARRRAAHPAGAADRHGHRPRPDGSLRAAALALRGPDGHRRRAARRASPRPDIPAASLWAAVPGYAAQVPSPKAAMALVERACSMIGTPRPLGARRAGPPSTTRGSPPSSPTTTT